MEKHYILVSGPTVASDDILINELQRSMAVFKNSDNCRIEMFIGDRKVDLILFEISKEATSEVEIIKNVKSNYPDIKIILINGDGDSELIAKAYAYGAIDAFRMPYKTSLIVERVKAILDKLQSKMT